MNEVKVTQNEGLRGKRDSTRAKHCVSVSVSVGQLLRSAHHSWNLEKEKIEKSETKKVQVKSRETRSTKA